MASFATAFINLQRGHKVGRKHWGGYWHLVDGEVIMHTWDGKDINIKDTDDILYTLSNVACDDWEIKESEY